MRHGPGRTPEPHPGRGGMEGNVVEHRFNPVLRQLVDQARALLHGTEQHVIHVGVMRAMLRNARTPQHSLFFQWSQRAVVHIPPFQPFAVDFLPVFQLGIQISGGHLSGQIGRTNVHPSVFVHLPAEKPGPVGPFFPDNLRAFHQGGVIHQQGPSLPGNDILGLVETVAAQMADGAEPTPSVTGADALGGIFNHVQAVPPGNANQQNTIYTDFSKPNITSNTPTYWMRASEVYFLRAEAALRWGSEFGDAEALYEQGVATSFDENGISSSVDDYLASGLTPIAHNMRASYYSYNAAAPTTATPAFSGGTEQKLEKIMIQKWIALYPNGHEAWTEWRRTGYPKLNQVQTNRGQGVTREGGIRRMVYPVSFYQSAEDRANYEEALKLLGGLDKDKATTQLWWDCKNKIY